MKYIWINGEMKKESDVTISPYDLGLTRGYGVCDFLSVTQGIPLYKENHISRFINSQKIIGIESRYSDDVLQSAVDDVVSQNGIDRGSVKMIATGGVSIDGIHPSQTSTIIIQPEELVPVSPELFKSGVPVMTFLHTRELPEAKTLAYCTRIMLRSEIDKNKLFEIIWHDGTNVSEASTSNVFIIKNGEVYTAKSGILHGITRKKVIELAKTKYKVHEKNISLAELFDADEVFLTATNKFVLPVIRIDETPIGDGTPGPISKDLLELYIKNREEYINNN